MAAAATANNTANPAHNKIVRGETARVRNVVVSGKGLWWTFECLRICFRKRLGTSVVYTSFVPFQNTNLAVLALALVIFYYFRLRFEIFFLRVRPSPNIYYPFYKTVFVFDINIRFILVQLLSAVRDPI